jgi:DNA-binding transcriptional MerR regulator
MKEEMAMEYTVNVLSKIAGVSPRTLRYYDEIGLLSPQRREFSDYRIYGQKEVDRLQQILFYRELGVGLADIREILDSPGYDRAAALREHRSKILLEKHRLDRLLSNLDKTIANMEGETIMTDKEKFEGFKQNLIEENEKKYGREIRQKYGDAAVEGSYAKVRKMDAQTYARAKDLEERILEGLRVAMAAGDPAGEKAQETARLHKEWLCMYWDKYSGEAHAGVARMYTEDERFTAYYDKAAGTGAAVFLRDAILKFTETN